MCLYECYTYYIIDYIFQEVVGTGHEVALVSRKDPLLLSSRKKNAYIVSSVVVRKILLLHLGHRLQRLLHIFTHRRLCACTIVYYICYFLYAHTSLEHG